MPAAENISKRELHFLALLIQLLVNLQLRPGVEHAKE